MKRFRVVQDICAFVLVILVTSVFAAAQQPKQVTNSLGMKFKLIPEGVFIMGSPASEDGSEDDERQYEATITEPFYIGIFEVTQAQYARVMGNNPSFFQGDKLADRHPKTGRIVNEVNTWSYPVDQVSWADAMDFCKRLSSSADEKRAGREYRLPTEAQWEYACRAGTNTAFGFAEDTKTMDEYAWFAGTSEGKTHPIGLKKPNAWGLYDMHGNVREWCMDWYGDYPRRPTVDPMGPTKGGLRVLRGGSWGEPAQNCRCASRDSYLPTSRFNDNGAGFRVIMSVAEPR